MQIQKNSILMISITLTRFKCTEFNWITTAQI